MTQSAVLLKPLEPSEAQARLDALPGSNGNLFENMTWQFKNQNGDLSTVEFNDLLGIKEQYPDWLLAHLVDLVLITKWISLSHGQTTTSTISFLNHVNGLKLFWTAMATYNLSQLTRDNFTEVLTFLLTHGWRQGMATKNLVIKSYGNFSQHVKVNVWKSSFLHHGLDWIARDVTDTLLKKELKILVPKLTDAGLTYRDWFEGGSYNMLTLDYGRYYVEHCLVFFEKNYPLTMALASTYRAIPALAELCCYKQHTVNQAASLVLQGASVEDLKLQMPTWGITTLQNIHEQVSHYFESAYRQARLEAAVLQDETLEAFISACGLMPSSENIDRMRVILWDWLRRKDKIETQSLLDECDSIPWVVFENELYVLKRHYDRQPCPVPSYEEYQAMGLVERDIKDTLSSYSRQLIYLVSKAGLTIMAALTGWRRSEFGFPLSAIKRTRNNDKLDQYAFPWRYQVDWYVYKTRGKVRQLREIAFNTFLIAERMQLLIGATDEQPCLYLVNRQNTKPFDSVQIMGKGVRVLWVHFVKHYSGFKQLDDWSAWQALQKVSDTCKSFTQVEEQEHKRLLAQCSAEQWNHLLIDANLKETWQRARAEWPRIEIFLIGSTTADKKELLINYRDRRLRSDWQTVLDTHLSNSTKDWINSLSQDELKSANASTVVMNNLIEGSLYPTPHAFRHMWAEAVYRRFDGDAGWMIRSQFKHISRSMWLAYVRDKDNRFGHEKAKLQVISSLVRNYLKNKGEGYTGQMHIWLRRLFSKTTVLMPEEQEQLAEHLATVEIEDIKPSPWGYCLLKRRTKSKAKCAEMGEPMRHNASPDLCLGCIHNLMQAENVEWALFHVASHVTALKNPIVPVIFKASSYKLVKNLTQHVRTLSPKHEALTELQGVLREYEASRFL